MSGRHRLALVVGGSLVVAATVVLACTGNDPVLSPHEDGGDAGELGADAGVDADRPCDPSKPFDPPVPVNGLASGTDYKAAARFLPDERTVYFNIAGFDGGRLQATDYYSNIYTSSRASTTSGFASPQVVNSLSTALPSEGPTVTADGTTIFFTRYDDTFVRGQIWTASAATPSEPFTAPSPVPGLVNAGNSQGDPYVLPDGTALYFVSDRSGDPLIWRASRVNGELTNVQRVAGLQTGSDRLGSPVVTPDELTIYWASSPRVSNGPVVIVDIYVATRNDTTSPFSNRHAVSELNTPQLGESPSFVSADGCRLYYTSSLVTYGKGSTVDNFKGDVYVATKPK